jgi:hypothetical protein
MLPNILFQKPDILYTPKIITTNPGVQFFDILAGLLLAILAQKKRLKPTPRRTQQEQNKVITI